MSNPAPGMSSYTLPPFSAAPQQPEASTSSKKPRKRLTKEAHEILDNFYRTVSNTPSPAQRRQLAAQVNKIPNNEWYTPQNVTNFFCGRRKIARDDAGSRKRGRPVITGEDMMWPSLTKLIQEKLASMLKERPNANSKQIAIWADFFKVPEEEVIRWVEYHRAPEKPDGSYHDHDDGCDSEEDMEVEMQHLPTPEATASPEPTFRVLPSPTVVAPPYSPMSPISPVAAPFSSRSQSGHDRTTPSRQVSQPPQLPGPPTASQHGYSPSTPPYASFAPNQKPVLQSPLTTSSNPVGGSASLTVAPAAILLQSLAHAFRDALSAETNNVPSVGPVTPADFARQFEPHEQRMHEFLEQIRSGTYATLGLTSDMISESELKPEP